MIIYYTLSYSGKREDSHKLLIDAIAEYIGNRDKAEALVSELKRGKNGKPYIEGFLHFSISHSGRAWAVLFSEDECGIDIQYGNNCDQVAIAKRLFAPEDVARISNNFFRIWTRREALAKALGGSAFDTSLPAVASEDVIEILDKEQGKEGAREQFIIKDITLPGAPELYASICIKGEPQIACDEITVHDLCDDL